LKPCPFCGGSNLTVNTSWVECDDCILIGPKYDAEGDAIDAWNRRALATASVAPEPSSPAVRRALEAICKMDVRDFIAVRTDYGNAWNELKRAIESGRAALASEPETVNQELLAAAQKFLDFYTDLGESNPGFMRKLTLQNYARWNEAMCELPAAIARASAVKESA
jgi:Lar family restriction alleviation protein